MIFSCFNSSTSISDNGGNIKPTHYLSTFDPFFAVTINPTLKPSSSLSLSGYYFAPIHRFLEQEKLTSLEGGMTSQGLIANQQSPTILDLYSSDSAGLVKQFYPFHHHVSFVSTKPLGIYIIVWCELDSSMLDKR